MEAIKVFITEDERIVREGLRDMIPPSIEDHFPSGKLVKKSCSSVGRPDFSFSAAMALIRKAMLRPRLRMVWSPSRSFFTSSAEKPCT